MWTTPHRDDVIPYVEWAMTSAAIDRLGNKYLIHAGVVARDGRGLILPAASGSGKSSLVAGLVGAGWTYLSDEVAVIEPGAETLLPFAKSIHLHAGAREALLGTLPMLSSLESRRALDGTETWYVPPQLDWLPPAPAAVSAVVVPSFEPGARTALTPAPASTTLRTLLEQSFNLRQHGPVAVGDLVQVLRRANCYTLAFSNVDEAVRVLSQGLPSGPSPDTARR